MKKLLSIILFFSFNLKAATNHHLTLYFIPSPIGIDWSTPANLAWSALKNKISLQSRFMGHVFIEVQCDSQRDMAGMTSSKFDYIKQVVFEGRGLGVLYHSFEGKIEDPKDIEKEIQELAEDGKRLNFAKFLLNPGQCQRALTYMKEYREKNLGKYYGLVNRPLYGEGSGCSAYGASFLEVTGLLDDEIKKAWSNSVRIPVEFAGPPLRNEKVNILSLMFNAGRWALEKEPHHLLSFWSPDQMYQWVVQKVEKSQQDKTYMVDSIQMAKGVVYDKSHLESPVGPIWKNTTTSN